MLLRMIHTHTHVSVVTISDIEDQDKSKTEFWILIFPDLSKTASTYIQDTEFSPSLLHDLATLGFHTADRHS